MASKCRPADGNRVAKQQPRLSRTSALQLKGSTDERQLPVDRCRAHPPELVDRLRGSEGPVEIPGRQEQRKPLREHHHEVTPARQPHKLPQRLQQPTPRTPYARSRNCRLSTCSAGSGRRGPARSLRAVELATPVGCRNRIQNSVLVGLGLLAIGVTKLVRDLPSRTHVSCLPSGKPPPPVGIRGQSS